jgi:hypothetical protein
MEYSFIVVGKVRMRKITCREAGKLILLSGAGAGLGVGAQRVMAQGYPGEWMAQWVWVAVESEPFHFFLMARRNFDLEARPNRRS